MTCFEKGCKREAKSRGLCHKHYKRMRRRELSPSGRMITDPNEFVDCGDYWKIKLYDKQGTHVASTKVDKDDLEKCCKYKWSLHNEGYVVAKGGRVLLHRLILGLLDSDLEADHIYRDRLDNRKSKLRVCSSQQNNMNVGLQGNNTSGFKGVYFLKSTGKWMASIQFRGKQKWLGSFVEKEDAARAYNDTARKLFGRFALLNQI